LPGKLFNIRLAETVIQHNAIFSREKHTMQKTLMTMAKANPIRVGFTCVFVAHALWSLLQPSSNSIHFTDERMIGVARQAAHAAFYGETVVLSRLMDGENTPAKVDNCMLMPPPSGTFDGKLNKQSSDYFAMTRAEADVDSAQLVRVEKVRGYYANATFVMSDASTKEPLWVKPFPAVITVMMKYSEQPFRNWFNEYTRQFVNASYLPDFIREKASGDWGMVSEVHLYCASEYYKALIDGKAGIQIEKPSKYKDTTLDDKAVVALVKEAMDANTRLVGSVADRMVPELRQAVDDIRANNELPPLPPEPSDVELKPPVQN